MAGAGASGSVWSRCIGEGGREAPLPGHLCLSRAVSPLTWQPLLPIKAPKGGKEYVKAVYCHLAYQLLCRVHHLNAGLDEAQAGIKMAGRDTNNLRYADDTTFMTERQEELKSLLMKLKEESEKAGLKINIQKMIMASIPITSWQIDGEKNGNSN